jgi:cytochrome c-type biogenesis protein CcmH/NrfG
MKEDLGDYDTRRRHLALMKVPYQLM